MPRWIVAVGLLVIAVAATLVAHATGWVTLSWAHVFRVPRPEAVGAAIGAATAVNVGLFRRKRGGRGGWPRG